MFKTISILSSFSTLLAQNDNIVTRNEVKKMEFTPNINAIKSQIDVDCFPKAMCLRLDSAWLNVGIPNNLIYPNGSPNKFTTFVDEEDGPLLPTNDAISLSPYMGPKFTKDNFNMTLSMFDNCGINNQSYVQQNGKQFWSGCIVIDQNQKCLTRKLTDSNTQIMFSTWFETQNEKNNVNFALPLQCSYYLNYNVDLYLGTVELDKWGNPKFDPANNGTIPGCAVDDPSPLCDDSNRTPGYIIPQLYTVENITIITSATENKGTFPVYMFLYDSEKYENYYTKAPIKNETERLYLETGVINPIEGAVLQTEQCWASPTESREIDETVFMLIKDFCPTKEAVSKVDLKGVFFNGEKVMNRYDGDVFQFTGDSDKVYIYCKIKICINYLSDNQCAVPECAAEGGQKNRRKRGVDEVANYAKEQKVTLDDGSIIGVGPIYPQNFAKNNAKPIVFIGPEVTKRLIHEITQEILDNSSYEAPFLDIPQWSGILLIGGLFLTGILVAMLCFNYFKMKSEENSNCKV